MWTRVNAAVGRLHPWRLSRVCCGPGNESRRGRWLRAVALAPAGSGFHPEPAGAARRLCVVTGRQLGSRALAGGPKSRPAAAEALPVPKRQTTAEPTVSGRPRRVVLGFRVPSAAPPSLGPCGRDSAG